MSVMFSSKDRLVKFWDLAVQHCFRTLVHKSEVINFSDILVAFHLFFLLSPILIAYCVFCLM